MDLFTKKFYDGSISVDFGCPIANVRDMSHGSRKQVEGLIHDKCNGIFIT